MYQWAVIRNVASQSGDIGFSSGQIVRVGDDRWQIAAVLFVREDSQYDQRRNGEIELFGMEWTGTRLKRFLLTHAAAARKCVKNA